MNYKWGNQIFVNDIYLKNNNEYECLAAMHNLSNLRERIAVGEGVSSNDFVLFFPKSIGESKWKLVFYPNGQYIGEKVGNYVAIYLVMLSCENDVALTANVAFQLKSQHEGQSGPVKNLNAEFVFSNPSKRWIGKPDFVGKNWLNSKSCSNFFSNDTLTISFSIEETHRENEFMRNEPINEESSGPDKLSKTGDQQKRSISNSPDDFKNEKESGWIIRDIGKGRKRKRKGQTNQENIDASKPKSSVYKISL